MSCEEVYKEPQAGNEKNKIQIQYPRRYEHANKKTSRLEQSSS